MSRRSRWSLTVGISALALAVDLVLVTPGTATADVVYPVDGYGFGQGYMATADSAADSDRELDAVSQTSASWLRVPIDWSAIEATRGQQDWGYLDHLVDSAAAHGLRVLGLITYTPLWARAGDAAQIVPSAPPADLGDWSNFVTQVVQRYGSRIQNWEIWNEPNLPAFFGFVPGNKAQRYVGVLQSAYTAIKAVQPDSTVVAAGLSRQTGPDSPPGFLQQIYDAGGKGYFDAAAAHPYVTPTGLAADPDNGWSDVGRMHDIMAANGDGDKKIWLTELGAPTCNCFDGVSQQEQANQITDVLAAAANTPYIGPAFVYSIRDSDSTDGANPESNFGTLLTTDWQPKAAAGVLAR